MYTVADSKNPPGRGVLSFRAKKMNSSRFFSRSMTMAMEMLLMREERFGLGRGYG
jgi:hypothetical protein